MTVDQESKTYTEQEVLDVLIRIDRAGQKHYHAGMYPLAGTGAGYISKAIGLQEASNMLRQLLGMPRHRGFRRDG